MEFIGYVDACDDGLLSGWAAHPGRSEPVTVEVLCDGHVLGTTSAGLYREDLKNAGIGDGRHGFEFRLPETVRTRREYHIDVREAGGAPLGQSPFRVREDRDHPLTAGGTACRRFIAAEYCRGNGFEIGALHKPMPLPSDARVRYIDSFSTDTLTTLWSPEVDGHHVVPVDIVADATTLAGVADAAADFVIASHVVEHIEDPVRCLFNLLRVVKPGGVVLLGIPDRRNTFDAGRPATPIEHVVRDWCAGPAWSRRAHYDEWVRLVERPDAAAARDRIETLFDQRYPIHFHVWDPSEFTELLNLLRTLSPIAFDIDFFKANPPEGIWVLRRSPAA